MACVGSDEDAPSVLVKAKDEASVVRASEFGIAGVEDLDLGLRVNGKDLSWVGLDG